MAKINLPRFFSGFGSTEKLNQWAEQIEEGLENTLSRDGTLPNQMEADIDMDGNDVLNAKQIDAQQYLLNGVPFEQEVAYASKLYQLFSGNSVQTDFTLDVDPASLGNLEVSVGGVMQRPGLDYTYSGTTLHFLVAPATGANNILVRYDQALLGVQDAAGLAYTPPSTLVPTTVKGFLDDLWATGSALVRFIQAGIGASARTVQDKLRDVVAVTDYGAVGDGVTDDTVAVQTAINAAIAGGWNKVYFPGGRTYYFDDASASLDPGSGDMVFYGDGQSSVLLFNEGTSLAAALDRKHLFRNTTTTLKGHVEFRDLSFKGTWTAGGETERGGSVLFLWWYAGLKVTNCSFYDTSWAVSSCENIGRVQVSDCTFERCVRDMIRMRSSFNVTVTGNIFKQCDDDPIALHQWDVYSENNGDVREGIVVADNQFEDCGPVRILSGRMVNISDNIFRRSKSAAIAVYADALNIEEGDVPLFGISITGNQIYDTLARAPFSAPAFSVIGIFGIGRKGGTSTGGVVPGEATVGTGGFVKPWDWRIGRWSDANDGYPSTHYVHILDNTIARTLPAVAGYSDWGYGEVMSAGGFSDDAVSDSDLRPTIGINLDGDVRRCTIRGNMISHVDYGILFNTPGSNYALDSTVIAFNHFSDFAAAGVCVNQPGVVKNINLRIADNDFDGDPYHINGNRGSNGTWLSSAAGPFAVLINEIAGWSFERNRIKNVSVVYKATYYGFVTIVDNLLRCQPAVHGFHVTNRGIGQVETAGVQFRYEIVNSDPVSASYGLVTDESLTCRPAIPTTGFYVKGTFVQADGSTTILGWQRLTTGSAHVVGTDWKTVALT